MSVLGGLGGGGGGGGGLRDSAEMGMSGSFSDGDQQLVMMPIARALNPTREPPTKALLKAAAQDAEALQHAKALEKVRTSAAPHPAPPPPTPPSCLSSAPPPRPSYV